jgi:hypothetical protein
MVKTMKLWYKVNGGVFIYPIRIGIRGASEVCRLAKTAAQARYVDIRSAVMSAHQVGCDH